MAQPIQRGAVNKTSACYTRPRMASDELKTLDSRIARLLRLAGTDEAFFVVALHSFIEAFIREEFPPLRNVEGFAALLRAYGDYLEAQGPLASERETIVRLIQEHVLAVRVIGSFGQLDREEVLAATHNFLRFANLCQIDAGVLEPFRRRLELWDAKDPAREKGGELQRIGSELLFAQADGARLLSQTEAWAEDKQRLAELEGRSLRLEAACAREKTRQEPGSLEKLKRELREIELQKRALSEKLAAYRDLDLYVDQMGRFSLYTRTRMDYERSVMRLTPEQQEAVDAVKPGFDFLIRGGAGTGKTIVLLHAFRKIKRAKDGELELRPGMRLLFLTYTNTLVKYDRYVAEILQEKDSGALIVTAESFFLERLAFLGAGQRVDYRVLPRLAEKLNTTDFFTAQELATEIEDFLFGSLVTRQEYVDQRIARRGMRQPLSQGQREKVWAIRESIAAEMDFDGLLSKNYSRMKIIEHMEAHPDDTRLADLDFAFVDESQDFSAADLRALKLMTRRGLVLAGDAGQSIYGASSPYARAGADIAGRSRVLHTSFRNTVAIHEVAERYRALSGLDRDEAGDAVAFRTGPPPELSLAATREELARLLLRKAALFIDRLGYDPENITILAPTRTDLATIGDMLGRAGYLHANIRDEDFSFKQEKTIRLSTLHSSKGLDFPVVLLYLPSLLPRAEYDEKTEATLARNLIYVAMTRAMDNLNAFTLEGSHEGQYEEPLQDLVKVFREYRQIHGG
jgi:hypothetical protein